MPAYFGRRTKENPARKMAETRQDVGWRTGREKRLKCGRTRIGGRDAKGRIRKAGHERQDTEMSVSLKEIFKDKPDPEKVRTAAAQLLEERPEELDFSALTNISGTQLRLLLRLSRALEDGKRLRIRNASPEVCETLREAGLTDLMDVDPVLKEISVDGCSVLGKGYCGTVYQLDGERIIKVYDAPRHAGDFDLVKRELDMTRKAVTLGLPVNLSYGAAVCGGYYAGIYEMIDGDTLGNTIARDPTMLETYARKMARIGRYMASLRADPAEYPSAAYVFTRRRRYLPKWLSAQELAAVDERIGAIPEMNRLVHGDFHVENIMVRSGELVMIDAGGFMHGHPVIDLLCLYLKTTEPDYLKTRLTDDQCRQFFDFYLDEFFGDALTPQRGQCLNELLKLMADLFMLPTPCAIAGTQETPGPKLLEEIRSHLGRILEVTPERMGELFEAIGPLYEDRQDFPLRR